MAGNRRAKLDEVELQKKVTKSNKKQTKSDT
jgi:hypothetical protein